MEEKKEAKSSEEGEAEPEGLDDAADAVKFRIWIPVEENKAEILESDPEDVENECEKEIKWQLLEEIQEGMELGTFNFKPGATPILIERCEGLGMCLGNVPGSVLAWDSRLPYSGCVKNNFFNQTKRRKMGARWQGGWGKLEGGTKDRIKAGCPRYRQYMAGRHRT
eukprot:1373082-Amorphochlora_amoeboformis.AAC.1